MLWAETDLPVYDISLSSLHLPIVLSQIIQRRPQQLQRRALADLHLLLDITKAPEKEGGFALVHRKPLVSLTPGEVERIRDRTLRAQLKSHLTEAAGKGLDHKKALAEFAESHPVRRVRLLKKDEVVPIVDRNGRPYKAYAFGENLYVDIFETPDGSWLGEGATRFDANRDGHASAWKREHRGSRLVMRLYKNDVVRMEHDGVESVFKVYSLEPSAKRVRLTPHEQAGNPDKRHVDPDDPFRRILMPFARMKEARARKVRVDEIGRVHDPGPPR
jgi:CRISPR-associated endonuclease Csn1